MNISEGSIGDELIGVCLNEVHDTVNGPYADLQVHRHYRFIKHDDVVFVREHLTYHFYSLSDKETKKTIWRSLVSGLINSDKSDEYQNMSCSLLISGADAKENGVWQAEVVECTILNGERVFDNPFPPIHIPPFCENLTLTLDREFYLPSKEQRSSFDWEYPLRSLIYDATFEDETAVFSPMVTNCSQCSGLKDCGTCACGKVEIKGRGTSSIHIETNSWVGSKMGILLKWDFTSDQ